MAPTRFYAIQHTFGPEIRDPKGWYIGFAYRFTTQAARDAFVQAGPKREAVDRSTLLSMGFREQDFRDGEDATK
jgi:hypothetical protein